MQPEKRDAAYLWKNNEVRTVLDERLTYRGTVAGWRHGG